MHQYTDRQLTRLPDLITLVRQEHRRQIKKWGIQRHSAFEWVVYVMEELGELAEAISDHEYNCKPALHAREEAVEAATLLLKIAEFYMPDAFAGEHTVYLAGPILDCDELEIKDWRDQCARDLPCPTLDPARREFQDEQMENLVDKIINPDKADIDASTIVLAHCWKPSAGTSMEILYAFEHGKIVISVVPPGLPVSAWVAGHSDIVCRTMPGAIAVIRSLVGPEE